MSTAEITAILRITAYILALIGIVMWAHHSRQRFDRLGAAVLLLGAVVAALSGLTSDQRDLEGVVRMPFAVVICAYVLSHQRGVPPWPRPRRND